MNTRLGTALCFLYWLPACYVLLQPKGAETEGNAVAAAWADVEKGHSSLRPPADWRNKKPSEEEIDAFRSELNLSALGFAQSAREFLQRHPESENASDARFTVIYALGHAVATGDLESEKEAERFVDAALRDPHLGPEEKAKILLMASNVQFMKKLGMRFFTEDQQNFTEEMDKAMTESLLAAKRRFPNSEFIYSALLAVADRSGPAVQKELVNEILSSPGAPKEVKFFAEHLASGTKPYEVGKPVEIRFTSLDGDSVDLAQMKGKVVLVDFWSTTCGPCVAQIPELKALNEKYGPKGLRIIGINLDEKEAALRRFIRQKGLDWPQHFAGKGWANPIATRYGIFAIPTNWLIDKKGNLRETQARGDLHFLIADLLAEAE